MPPKVNYKSPNLWRSVKDYVIITFGLALYAFGFSAFIFPERIVTGGLTGLCTIIFLVTGIPVALSTYAINIMLLFMAYRIVGKQFVLATIYGATMVSVFIGAFVPIFADGIIHGQPFMSVVIGGGLCGIGIGLAFVHNGSSGGTDIIAAMVAKKSNVTIGRTLLCSDIVIVSSSFFLFHNLEGMVYGFVVMVLVSYTADMVINTNRQAVQFIIFSRKWEAIADAINTSARRGCTVINGEGWYSKSEVKILLVMCRKIESVTVSRIIKSIDPGAFVAQSNVNGVYGQGFDELKVKMRKKHPAPASEATPEATPPSPTR